MITMQSEMPSTKASRDSAADIFQREWRLYQKMVDRNYLFHREAYSRLRRVLLEDAALPFRFLDLACGDASATATALEGTRIASYCGVDLSAEALDLAAAALRSVSCPVSLRQEDFFKTITEQRDPVDIVWIGLSLHHLRTPAKLDVMRAARRLVDGQGKLLLYENASPDGEDRKGWLERWDLQERQWTGLTTQEWCRVRAHVRTYDFPETVSGWRELGREAGFAAVRELFVTPTSLFRLFSFQPYPNVRCREGL
jgi:SAM-dependent methyltransferase